MRIKLTKAVVDAIDPPDDGVLFVRDAELPGFALRVTKAGAKSWVVERKVGGKTVRATLGRVGVMSLPAARVEGMQMLAAMAAGERPEKAAAAAAPLTLAVAFEDYIKERTSVSPGLKASTAGDYRSLFGHLADWHDLEIGTITRAMVAERHMALTAKPSPATANRVMRVLSAVMNYAVDNDRYGGAVLASPVSVLRQRRLWNKNKRRTTYLDAHTLPVWWALVDDVGEERWPDRCDVVRDYWRFLLLTGMRSDEGARVRVDGVDLVRGTFEIADPKNRDDRYIAPAGEWLLALLRRRVAAAKAIGSQWVFPAPKRPAGYTSPAHDIREILNAKHGLEWTPHDLRRTFATTLDSMEVSPYAIKRLLGHRSSGDVTEGYVQQDIDRLRPVVERVQARLLGLCGA